VAEFVSSDDDSREASRVLHYGHRIDLFQALVHDASATYVSESGGASVAFSVPRFTTAHVQPAIDIKFKDAYKSRG